MSTTTFEFGRERDAAGIAARTLGLFAAAVLTVGAWLEPAAAWPQILIAGFFLIGMALAGGFFNAIHVLSGARWFVPLRRVADALGGLAIPGIALLLACATLGRSTLYGHHVFTGFKGVWLAPAFFTGRAFAYAALWIALTRKPIRSGRAAGVFVVAFAISVWLASVDFIMALEPHWASTMFGVYHFVGLVSAGFALIAVAAIALRRRGLIVVSDDHLHDLGKLVFAFSIFWAYIWFSQAMLIWYGNMPEEAHYYALRIRGGWGVLFVTTVLLRWVIPFVVLLPEAAKRSETVLLRVSAAILVGHWMDLYVSIVPAQQTTVAFTGWAAAAIVGAAAAAYEGMRRRSVSS